MACVEVYGLDSDNKIHYIDTGKSLPASQGALKIWDYLAVDNGLSTSWNDFPNNIWESGLHFSPFISDSSRMVLLATYDNVIFESSYLSVFEDYIRDFISYCPNDVLVDVLEIMKNYSNVYHAFVVCWNNVSLELYDWYSEKPGWVFDFEEDYTLRFSFEENSKRAVNLF